MRYLIVLVVGLVVGHFGPITVSKWIAGTTAKTLTVSGKAIDSVNKMVK